MRIILTLLISFLVSCTFAQRDSLERKFQFGVCSNLSLARYEFFTQSYGVLLRKGNHQFELGPKFGLFRDQRTTRKMGVDFNYHYYPNGINKHFSAFFLMNLDYFDNTEEYSNNHDGYFLEQSKTTYNFYALNLGYGFNLKMWGGLYFNTQVGFGVIVEDYSYYRTTNSTYYDDVYNYHVIAKPNVVVQSGLGYRF